MGRGIVSLHITPAVVEAARYWSIPSSGAPFGSFVNHNHFAYYINPCIGLTLGLLLSRSHGSSSRHGDLPDVPLARRLLSTLGDLLRDPAALWISGDLALMLSGIVLCLSRGGYIALLAALTVCAMLILVRGRRNVTLCATLLGVAASLALLIWFGLDIVEARLATFWTGEAIRDDRVFLLTNAWHQIKEFPVWGGCRHANREHNRLVIETRGFENSLFSAGGTTFDSLGRKSLS